MHDRIALLSLIAVLLTPVAVRAQAPPASQVVIALDNSGSMRANDPQGLVRAAVAELVLRLDQSMSVGLVTFDEHARVVAPLRPMSDAPSRAALVQATQAVAFDGRLTNIPEGVERALYELKQAGPAERKLVVVITDGIIDTGSPQSDGEKARWLRESLLPDCRASSVKVLGVAFTEKADYALLQEMAQGTDGSYYRALAQADVPGLFAQLQQVLTAPPPPAPVVKVERVEVPVTVEKAVFPRSLLIVVICALALAGLALVFAWWRSSRGTRDDVPAPEIVLHDLASGHQHRFHSRSVRIGRRDENDLVIPKPTISGHHAIMESRGGTFAIQDLRSTNGTFVNDARVERETILRNGDVVRFDKYKFAYEVPGEMDADKTSMGFNADRTMAAALDVPRAESTLQQVAVSPLRGGGPSTQPPRERATERTPPELEISAPGTVGTCPDHPSMFATEKCGKCGKKACYSCIRIVEGLRRCQSCG